MIEEGHTLEFAHQTQTVLKCPKCYHLMVILDPSLTVPGDLVALKKGNLRLGNEGSIELMCLNCEFPEGDDIAGKRIARWFESDSEDDSAFFDTPNTFTFVGSPLKGGYTN